MGLLARNDKDADGNWNYKEFDDEESCFEFIVAIKASGDVEYKVFKEDLDF